MTHSRRFLTRCGPEVTHKALQLALEIYARVPLIPRSLFMSGTDIQIDFKDFNGLQTGTLVSVKHEMKVFLWDLSYGISVCYPFSSALWNVGNANEAYV